MPKLNHFWILPDQVQTRQHFHAEGVQHRQRDTLENNGKALLLQKKGITVYIPCFYLNFTVYISLFSQFMALFSQFRALYFHILWLYIFTFYGLFTVYLIFHTLLHYFHFNTMTLFSFTV